MKNAVIVPAFNEAGRIRKTLEALQAIEKIDEIILVDDGSKDDTVLEAKNSNIGKLHIIELGTNQGKGKALEVGVDYCLGKFSIIGFVDGDLMESASEFEKLFEPVINGIADVTIAKFPPAKKKGGFGFVKKLARDGVKYHTGVELTSTLSGQRVFKEEVLKNIRRNYYGYGVEVSMTIDILKKGYKIEEVLVNMTHNETGRDLKGFIHRGRQFAHIVRALASEFFRRG